MPLETFKTAVLVASRPLVAVSVVGAALAWVLLPPYSVAPLLEPRGQPEPPHCTSMTDVAWVDAVVYT